MTESKRVCLLTGASGTLGQAFCRRFAAQFRIIGIYHARYPNIATQDQILIDPFNPEHPQPENTHRVTALRADLMRDADLLQVVDFCTAESSGVDTIVNMAAYSYWSPILGEGKLLGNILPQLYLNAVVPFKLSALIARRSWIGKVVENRLRNRSVLNISSTAASKVYEGQGQSAYAASKAALNVLTQHMASEFEAIGIRANVLEPNSFPGRVSIQAVLDEIERLITGSMTGAIRRIGEPSLPVPDVVSTE